VFRKLFTYSLLQYIVACFWITHGQCHIDSTYGFHTGPVISQSHMYDIYMDAICLYYWGNY